MVVANTSLEFSISTTWNGSSFDWSQSYTVPTDADVLVLRIVGSDNAPDSVLYNGSALTLRASQSDSNAQAAYIYDIDVPDAGANDIVLNTGGFARGYLVVVTALSSVDLAAPRGTPLSQGGFLSSVSQNVTTLIGGMVLDVLGLQDDQTATVGAGQTEEVTASVSAAGHIGYASKEAATATTTTMSWSASAGDWTTFVAQPYNPAASGPVIDTEPTELTLGVEDTITVSGVSVAPDTSDTITNGAATIAITSVTGSDPYILTYTPQITLPKKLSAVGYAWTLNLDAETVDTSVLPLDPQVGYSFTDLTSVATAGDRITAVPDLSANDQLEHQIFLYQGGSPTDHTVVINADATFTITQGALPIVDGSYTFEVRAWSASVNLWGTAADQTVTFGGGTSSSFYSNEGMIAFFRAQTGLSTYSFNELAIAYYNQVGGNSSPQFNDALKAAQDAIPFKGLAPTDWRNF